MIGSDAEDVMFRGEVLVQLRHGIRQSSRLAEQLTADFIVGHEARSLLGRLEAIRAELDAMRFAHADPRRAENDPFWSEPPNPFRQTGTYDKPR